jgi:Kef-type K+ transport system membrane component KefB
VSQRNRKFALAYIALVGLPVAVLVGILKTGRNLVAPPGVASTLNLPSLPPQLVLNLFVLVLQITVILAVCRLMGSLFRTLHQPRVVGEMFAGILLGPSLLGWIAPSVSAYLFPQASLSFLNALSQVGVVIFMFLVGMELNPKELKHMGHTAMLAGHVGITVPFVLAAGLAIYLYPRLSASTVSFSNFALFLGAAMSMTAFPVLARILSERNLLHSRLGTLAVACAAVGDVTGWCILAYIVVLIRSAADSMPLSYVIGGIVLFVLIMVYVVRPLIGRLETIYARDGYISENLFALVLLLVLISGLCTERLGVHLLFGSFFMGAIMPKEPRFVRYILDRFEMVTLTLLLPLFFVVTGLRTNVAAVKGPQMWFYCALIILVATVGKLGGSATAARISGMSTREALGLGALMNTRGLMELIILNIGLDIGVISPALFSMMVIMALFTTFMTTPALELICPTRMLSPQVESDSKPRAIPPFASNGSAA